MEISFGKIVIVLLIIAGIWGVGNFAMGYYTAAKMESAMQGVIFKNKEASDEILKSKVVEAIRAEFQVELKEEQVIVLRASDGGSVRIRIPYEYPAKIPIVDKVWLMKFEPEVEENIKFTRGI